MRLLGKHQLYTLVEQLPKRLPAMTSWHVPIASYADVAEKNSWLYATVHRCQQNSGDVIHDIRNVCVVCIADRQYSTMCHTCMWFWAVRMTFSASIVPKCGSLARPLVKQCLAPGWISATWIEGHQGGCAWCRLALQSPRLLNMQRAGYVLKKKGDPHTSASHIGKRCHH